MAGVFALSFGFGSDQDEEEDGEDLSSSPAEQHEDGTRLVKMFQPNIPLVAITRVGLGYSYCLCLLLTRRGGACYSES